MHGECEAFWNMAVDVAIHDAVEIGLAPPTLRLYRWAGAAVTIGCHQSAQRSVRLDACEELGVPVVRRPTGGRGILHGADQTVSVAAPFETLGARGRSVAASYHALSAGFAGALQELGVDVRPGSEQRPSAGVGDCFALRTGADLVTSEGCKLVGSAQHRGRTSLLQQSSLLHRPPKVDPAAVFLGPIAEAEYPLRFVDEDDLADALCAGFAEALGLTLHEDTLTLWEVERAAVVLAALRSRPVVDTPRAV